MKKRNPILVGILASIIALPSFAGGNELFEAKTATAAIEQLASDNLSNDTRSERKAKKFAAAANRKTVQAYRKCPQKPYRAARSLVQAERKLGRSIDKLNALESPSEAVVGLQSFAEATLEDIWYLAASDEPCDDGLTLSQAEDINYDIDPAPFVNFASVWGTLFQSAHGTFGDFAPQSTAPDHTHSGNYYGIVIKGILKNPFGATPGADLASAKPLPAGSFWQVPANAIHTTACDGADDESCLFYFHSRSAFNFDTDTSSGDPSGDSAQEISVEEINAALDRDDAVISPFARMVTLWGDRSLGAHGTVGRFIPGGASPLHTHSYTYHGVVLSGTMVNPFDGQSIEDARELQVGDYWFVPAGVDHVTACVSAEPCTFYFHSEGLFDFLTSD